MTKSTLTSNNKLILLVYSQRAKGKSSKMLRSEIVKEWVWTITTGESTRFLIVGTERYYDTNEVMIVY